MSAISLQRIVAEALAELGANVNFIRIPRGKPRSTTWLGVEHGFGIRHYQSGRNVYIVQTRMAGRLRTVTLGSAAVLTKSQATKVARMVIAYAQVGQDPATDRKRIRAAPRFDDFLIEYWARWSPRWKHSTYETHTMYRTHYLDGSFPGVFIDALNEADVVKWFADLNNRTGPGAANRVISILNHMLNKAESWGYRLENTNPCRGIRLNKRRQCERFLTIPELARLGEVLAEERAGESKVRPIAATAITMLLLTGCRHGEVLNLHWDEVRGNRLRLRDSKTGARTVWIGDEARTLIDTLPRFPSNPWLFWNSRSGRPLQNVSHYWHEFRAKAGLPGVRIHDLRHTFASHAAMNKETLPMIGRLLGHANNKSTARYAHLDDDHVLDAAQQIGDAIGRMMG
jgi:integrase